MKIGYFVENYKRGGIDTFIKNLICEKNQKDIYYLIYNNNNPGINFIKKNCKDIKYLKYSIFSWDKIFDKKINNYLLYILKNNLFCFVPYNFFISNIQIIKIFQKI